MPRYLLLIAGLVLPLFLAAQTSVSVTVVNGKDDQPIPYANLQVLGIRSGTSADQTGQFTLPLNKPRTGVRASALGFCSDTFPLSPGDQTIVLRLDMQYEKGKLVPIERILRNDYDWLFADCRDRVGEEFLYERKRLLWHGEPV
jgi:hypothetical protein